MFETSNKNQAPTANDLNEVNRSFGLDGLIGSMRKPKQQIHSSAPGAQPAADPSAPGAQQPPSYSYSTGYEEPEDYNEPISNEVAQLSGKTIAGTIDATLGTGFALYAKETNTEKYQANARQMDQLQDACTAVAAKYNYRVEESPWFNLTLLIVAIYLPKWMEAKNDRRFNEVEDRLRALEEKAEAKEAELKAQEEQKPAA